MSELHHLTVQDVIWIHFQLTRRVEPFRYSEVEEATYAQYCYGKTCTPVEAAARLLCALVKKRPFPTANEALALVAPLALLRLNGYSFSIPDGEALAWLVQTIAEDGSTVERIEGACTRDGHSASHATTVQEAVRAVLESYPSTIRGLLDANGRAA